MATPSRSSLSDRRRSGRVLLRVSVRVQGISRQGQHVTETGEAIVVSHHGALLKTESDFQPGTSVDLENPTTHETARFRVVWISDRPSDGCWDSGLEFASGNSNLWGIGFPFSGAEVR